MIPRDEFPTPKPLTRPQSSVPELVVPLLIIFVLSAGLGLIISLVEERDRFRDDMRARAVQASDSVSFLTSTVTALSLAEQCGPDDLTGQASADMVGAEGVTPLILLPLSTPQQQTCAVPKPLLDAALMSALRPPAAAIVLIDNTARSLIGVGEGRREALEQLTAASISLSQVAEGAVSLQPLGSAIFFGLNLSRPVYVALTRVPGQPLVIATFSSAGEQPGASAAWGEAVDLLPLFLLFAAAVAELVYLYQIWRPSLGRMNREARRYSLGLRLVSAGVLEWNVSFERIHYSPQWLRLVGLDAERMHGHIENYFQRIAPEDRERVLAAYQKLASGQERALQHDITLVGNGDFRLNVREAAVSVKDEDGAQRVIIVHEPIN